MITEAQRDRFRKLFTGLDRAYGRYEIDPALIASESGVKKGGKGVTESADLLPEMYDSHLDGEEMLGVIPIQDGSVLNFAAIDIDQYEDLDLHAIFKIIRDNKLPLVPTRSKSGGVHLYCFSAMPYPVQPVIEGLSKIGATLGFPGVEVFPKQKTITPTGLGNWINLPWFDVENTDRYGWDAETGAEIRDFGEWLDYAESHMMTIKSFSPAKVDKLENVQPTRDRPMTDGPPCLQRILERGIGDGERNIVMFNLAVYARNKFGDDATAMYKELRDMATKYTSIPLDDDEMNKITENVEKNAETLKYQCSQSPMSGHCQRSSCQGRNYGIQLTGKGHSYGQLWHHIPVTNSGIKLYDESSWKLSVDVSDVEYTLSMTVDELQKHGAIRKMLLNRAAIIPVMDADEWYRIVEEKVLVCETVHVPEEMTKIGTLRQLLAEYFDTYASNSEKEDILRNRAWHDVENSQYWGKRSLITKVLKDSRFETTPTELTNMMKEHMKARHRRLRVRPGTEAVSLWIMPSDLGLVDVSSVDEEEVPDAV